MKISRRAFLRVTAILSASGLMPRPATAAKVVHRPLGKTGLRVSEVGMGVMQTRDPAIVRAALDSGINYFDTARAYMGGRNEEILGKGLKGRRREAIVATKCHRLGNRDRVIASVERSLRTIGIDHVDVLQLHNLSSRREVLDEENLTALEKLRRDGKIRFSGVTTHSNMIEVMDATIEAGVFDTILTSFNFQSPPGVTEAVERCAKAGLGVVAMKIMTGGYMAESFPGFNHYQSALRWVLQHRTVATTIPSMATLDQLNEDAAVMGTALSWQDDLSLAHYAAVTGPRYCRACGDCLPSCSYGADIPAAMRAVMYQEGYREEEMARRTASSIALPCSRCESCTVSCSFGLDVPQRISSAVRLAAQKYA